MENQTVEYKSDIPKKQNDLKAEIVAFLNSNDGVIYLGVNDDGVAIPGKREKFKGWESLINNWINNAFNTTVQDLVKIDVSSESFVIRIKKGLNTPYYYKDGSGFNSKGIYIRCGSSKRQVTDEEFRRMLKAEVANEFDSQPSNVDTPLTFQYLKDKFTEAGIVFDEHGLRLLNTNSQYTNNALLLSEQNPFLTKIAVIDGLEMADFLAKKEFNGSLIKQVDMTLEYVSLLNDKRVSFTGAPARIEYEAYPSKAIREAIINAYAHRDYSLTADIKVEIYDDRMEIFSAGGIPDGLSVSDIKSGISARRNRNIVHVLDKLNYMENYASGIRRILTSYRNFSKEPDFIVTPNQFKVILYNRHYDSINEESSDAIVNSKNSSKNSEQLELSLVGNNEVNIPRETIIEEDSTPKELDPYDEKVIKLLKLNGKMGRQEIQSFLQESKSKTRQRLNKLKELNIIDTSGKSRSVVYFIIASNRKIKR